MSLVARAALPALALGLCLSCTGDDQRASSDGVASGTAVGDTKRDTDGDGPAVPEPDMADMEAQVADNLRGARSAVFARPDSAAAWGKLGMVCHAHELWDCAEDSYREALALDPLDERWHYYLGDVLSVVGTDLESAERAFRRVLDLKQDYAPTHLRLGRVLVEQNETAEAEAQLERALELSPDLQPARLALAQLRLAQGDLDSAAELLEAVLEANPKHKQALSTLGSVYMRQGRRDEARRIAERARTAADFTLYTDPLLGAVEAEGVSSLLLLNRARAFFDNGNFEQAARGFSRVVELLPEDSEIRYELAVSLHNLGQGQAAIPHLERLLELAPQRVDPRVLLASIYLDQQRPQDALPQLRQALRLVPEDPDAPWLLGRAQVMEGRLQEAIETFENARAASPSTPVPAWAHNEWGNALAQSGRLYGALEHFESALSAEPDNPQSLFYLGLVHEGLGGPRMAVDFYCRSLRSQPNPLAANRLQALGADCD